MKEDRARAGDIELTLTRLPGRSSPKASGGWLGVRDDFRNWLIRVA